MDNVIKNVIMNVIRKNMLVMNVVTMETMETMKVKAGDVVSNGMVLGTVGSSGQSTGPHLHYEVWLNNKPVNPMSVFTPRTAAGLSLNFVAVSFISGRMPWQAWHQPPQKITMTCLPR